MKLRAEMKINGKLHPAGSEVSWFAIYPFFMVHMLMFGGSGFVMAYAADVPVVFLYAHGGIAICVYIVFYLSIFGREEVRWMFMNAALGLFGIYAEVRWLLSQFGRAIDSYPVYIHVIPFLYYVLYTFLLRQAVVDIAGAREDPARRQIVERGYIAVSVIAYSALYLL